MTDKLPPHDLSPEDAESVGRLAAWLTERVRERTSQTYEPMTAEQLTTIILNELKPLLPNPAEHVSFNYDRDRGELTIEAKDEIGRRLLHQWRGFDVPLKPPATS